MAILASRYHIWNSTRWTNIFKNKTEADTKTNIDVFPGAFQDDDLNSRFGDLGKFYSLS